jgi:hypothetical protein
VQDDTPSSRHCLRIALQQSPSKVDHSTFIEPSGVAIGIATPEQIDAMDLYNIEPGTILAKRVEFRCSQSYLSQAIQSPTPS